jgi:hypothetical protein
LSKSFGFFLLGPLLGLFPLSVHRPTVFLCLDGFPEFVSAGHGLDVGFLEIVIDVLRLLPDVAVELSPVDAE